jgi:hypothetical protein
VNDSARDVARLHIERCEIEQDPSDQSTQIYDDQCE